MQGGLAAAFARVVDTTTNDTIVYSRAYTLSGGVGFLKRLKTESEWVVIPYFQLSYTNIWLTAENTRWDYEKSDSVGSYGGAVGLEIEMSPKMSVKGNFAFSFQSSDTVFSISLNFH